MHFTHLPLVRTYRQALGSEGNGAVVRANSIGLRTPAVSGTRHAGDSRAFFKAGFNPSI